MGIYGKEAKANRKNRIKELTNVVKGHLGWRQAFTEKYPAINTLEGARLLQYAVMGRTDDPDLLNCLEEFIPWVEETQPEWYKKKKTQEGLLEV